VEEIVTAATYFSLQSAGCLCSQPGESTVLETTMVKVDEKN